MDFVQSVIDLFLHLDDHLSQIIADTVSGPTSSSFSSSSPRPAW